MPEQLNEITGIEDEPAYQERLPDCAGWQRKFDSSPVVFRKLTKQKKCRLEAVRPLSDTFRMMLSIPPKYSLSQAVGLIKGESAIRLSRAYGERRRSFGGGGSSVQGPASATRFSRFARRTT